MQGTSASSKALVSFHAEVENLGQPPFAVMGFPARSRKTLKGPAFKARLRELAQS
jgi:hypothetical protein